MGATARKNGNNGLPKVVMEEIMVKNRLVLDVERGGVC